jgi:hypothetical protein
MEYSQMCYIYGMVQKSLGTLPDEVVFVPLCFTLVADCTATCTQMAITVLPYFSVFLGLNFVALCNCIIF